MRDFLRFILKWQKDIDLQTFTNTKFCSSTKLIDRRPSAALSRINLKRAPTGVSIDLRILLFFTQRNSFIQLTVIFRLCWMSDRRLTSTLPRIKTISLMKSKQPWNKRLCYWKVWEERPDKRYSILTQAAKQAWMYEPWWIENKNNLRPKRKQGVAPNFDMF